MDRRDYYRKGKENQRVGTENKTTVDKRIVARKVIDELNSRIDNEDGLKDVDTVHLLKFLQGVMPKEHAHKIDTTINYISNTPRPKEIKDKSPQVIDITPDTEI